MTLENDRFLAARVDDAARPGTAAVGEARTVNRDLTASIAAPRLSVFISSPGDVAEERLIAKRTLDRLAAEFAPVAKIEPVFWEHEPLSGQRDVSNSDLSRPSETDIVVCILWSRLGTQVAEAIHSSRWLALQLRHGVRVRRRPGRAASNAAPRICWFTARWPSRW